MRLSVVFSTYQSPRWLEKTFWGLHEQTHTDFEIIVADDGSKAPTRELIERMSLEFAARDVPVRHVWHPDEGFRKCRILNRAILEAASDYLVFTDGDCVCRADFLAVHAARAERGHYLSGSYYKLSMPTSDAITRDDVIAQRCFDPGWLRVNGMSRVRRSKLVSNATVARWLNRLTPVVCNLKGSNASAWRDDLFAAGGFDERMQWGGLDRELGVRLQNAGIRARHVRYDAICVHLDHARGYKDPERVEANRQLRLDVARRGIARTDHGIEPEDEFGIEQRAAALSLFASRPPCASDAPDSPA